jgi:hypothetical protein
MITFLLASVLSCADANWIISGVIKAEGISPQLRVELIEEIVRGTDGSCVYDLPDRSE